MREIKFRAKRAENGAWVYGDLTHVQKICTVEDVQRNGRRSVPVVRVANYNVDEKTIGQYTGLKDRNGREIYEGDVLRFDNYTIKVEWLNGGFCDCHSNIKISLRYFSLNHYEVIGNIHDNPELLTD